MTKRKPQMSRAHYVLIAGIVREIADPGIRAHVADTFTRELKGTNESYDSGRFRHACEPVPLPKLSRGLARGVKRAADSTRDDLA